MILHQRNNAPFSEINGYMSGLMHGFNPCIPFRAKTCEELESELKSYEKIYNQPRASRKIKHLAKEMIDLFKERIIELTN